MSRGGSILIDPDTHERMKEDGRPYSTLLRLAIEEFLDKAEKEAKKK